MTIVSLAARRRANLSTGRRSRQRRRRRGATMSRRPQTQPAGRRAPDLRDAGAGRAAGGAAVDAGEPIRVQGKFFFAGERQIFRQGRDLRPVRAGSHGAQFPERATVERDFALMRGAGVNTVRVFTVPPVWLLDARRRGRAEGAGRAALDAARRVSRQRRRSRPRSARRSRPGCAPAAAIRAVFAYLVGNEIPPDMIRWHGADAVREFLQELVGAGATGASGRAGQLRQFPVDRISDASISPISSASTSICTTRRAFRRYIARLHNLAVDKPLVLTEFGVDSMRNGEDEQAQILSWQVRAAFAVRGRRHLRLRLDRRMVHRRASDRGLGFRPGRPRPPAEAGLSRGRAAIQRRAAAAAAALPAGLGRGLRLQCRAHDGGRASPRSRRSNYPDYEVIVVNDGSTRPHPRDRRAVSATAGSSARPTRG